MDVNARESEFSLVLDEEELVIFTKVYKELKDTFRSRTQMAHIHIDDDMWTFTVIGLTPRNWVTLCAFVYNELPEEEDNKSVVQVTEGLSEEIEEALQLSNLSLGEESEEGSDDEEEEVEEEESDEEPESEAPKVIRKPVVVRKVGSNVTVESD